MFEGSKRFLCSAALAYPRAELPFIAEWLDYHLSLGVDHIFLGIHLNEEFRSPEFLMPAKRPFPAMYRLEGTEGDTLLEFHAEIAPFRNRLTTLLFRRDDHRLRTHNGAQFDLYRHVRDRHRCNFEWVAVHDIDEFLVPREHDDLKSALRSLPDEVSALRMRQVICESRWHDDHKPVNAPVLSRHRRLSEVIPASHGAKTISRLSRVKQLYIHHSLVDGPVTCNDSILHYHFRGFPSKTEIDTGHRLPVGSEDFDTLDDLPARLLARSRSTALPDETSHFPPPPAIESLEPPEMAGTTRSGTQETGPPVICINLDRAIERRVRMQRLWKDLFSPPFVFHKAIDRRDLDSGCQPPPSARSKGRELTTGEIACLMSHLEVLREWLPAIGNDGIIVLEDDIEPTPDASDLLGILHQAWKDAPQADFLMLSKPPNPYSIVQDKGSVQICGDGYPFGAMMIWYGPKAVRDYLDHMSDFSAPADHWLPFCLQRRFGVVKRHCCTHRSTDTFIGNQFRGPSAHRTFIP